MHDLPKREIRIVDLALAASFFAQRPDPPRELVAVIQKLAEQYGGIGPVPGTIAITRRQD